MNSYFDEKSKQISHSQMDAFGISLFSRYGKAYEMAEMINFANIAADLKVNTLVEEIIYDSKSTICNLKCQNSLSEVSPEYKLLKQIAGQFFEQYSINGDIFLGQQLDLTPNSFERPTHWNN